MHVWRRLNVLDIEEHLKTCVFLDAKKQCLMVIELEQVRRIIFEMELARA